MEKITEIKLKPSFKIIFCEECNKKKVHYLEENDFRYTEHCHWVCSHHSEGDTMEGKK